MSFREDIEVLGRVDLSRKMNRNLTRQAPTPSPTRMNALTRGAIANAVRSLIPHSGGLYKRPDAGNVPKHYVDELPFLNFLYDRLIEVDAGLMAGIDDGLIHPDLAFSVSRYLGEMIEQVTRRRALHASVAPLVAR